MKPTRALGLLCAALLVFGAAWTLWSREGRRGARGRSPSGGAGRADPEPSRGRGGIAVRSHDLDASAMVRGEVVDEDGVAVTEGAVMLECLQADTVRTLGTVSIGREGAFEGKGCRGTVCATLRHPFLVPAEPWVLQTGGASLLRARSLSRLWGEVVDAQGVAVAAARVSFSAADDDGERDPYTLVPLASKSTTTDVDGRFSVAWLERPPCNPCGELRGCEPLPLGAERLLATVGSRTHASVGVAFEADRAAFDDPDRPLRITVAAAGDLLTGRLRGPAGGNYARAYILARSKDRPREQRRAEVGTAGDFEVDGLGEGVYAVRAIQDGVELAVGEARAGEDVALEGTPSARGPALIVRVKDAEGGLISGARVDGGPFHGEKTDVRGEVRAEFALPGSLWVRVRVGPTVVRADATVPEAAEDLGPGETAHPHRVEVVVP